MRTIIQTQKEYTHTEIIVTCTCGATGEGNEYDDDVVWGNSAEVVDSTEIVSDHEEHASGEMISRTRYVVDVCPACFQTKVIPALQQLGFTVEVIREIRE